MLSASWCTVLTGDCPHHHLACNEENKLASRKMGGSWFNHDHLSYYRQLHYTPTALPLSKCPPFPWLTQTEWRMHYVSNSRQFASLFTGTLLMICRQKITVCLLVWWTREDFVTICRAHLLVVHNKAFISTKFSSFTPWLSDFLRWIPAIIAIRWTTCLKT